MSSDMLGGGFGREVFMHAALDRNTSYMEFGHAKLASLAPRTTRRYTGWTRRLARAGQQSTSASLSGVSERVAISARPGSVRRYCDLRNTWSTRQVLSGGKASLGAAETTSR